MKLIITDEADPANGLPKTSWCIDVPYLIDFDKINPDNESYHLYLKELNEFKSAILPIYSNYCQGRVIALYDFEIDIRNSRNNIDSETI